MARQSARLKVWIRSRPRGLLSTLCAITLSACGTLSQSPLESVRHSEPRYLFAWTGDEDRQDSDFLAVIDLARHGDRSGARPGRRRADLHANPQLACVAAVHRARSQRQSGTSLPAFRSLADQDDPAAGERWSD